MRALSAIAFLLLAPLAGLAAEFAGAVMNATIAEGVPLATIETVPPTAPVYPLPPSAPGSEPLVDLRPPDLNPLNGDEGVVPSWLTNVVDDHGLLPRALPEAMEIIGRDGDGLGLTTLVWKGAFGIGDGPLWIAPGFGWTFLNGPGGPDTPPQVYDLGIEINFSRALTDLWGLHLQVAPMFATDFDNESSDAFRLPAGGLLTFQLQPNFKLVGGLMYMDRPDLTFLPVGGVRWQPTQNLELDLLVPRPRIGWRFRKNQDLLAYVGGDVGGGSWAIEREPRRQDRMGYFDLRLVLGLEDRSVDGMRNVFEAGYVFHRRLEFDRYGGNQNLDPSFVLRVGSVY